MTDRTERFVDGLLEGVPFSRDTLELRERITEKVNARYEELLHSGKNDDEAFGEAVGCAGNFMDRINALKKCRTEQARTDMHNESSSDAVKDTLRKSSITALWMIIAAVYIVISFATKAWYVTWVIFLLGVALEQILKIIFASRTK